MTREPDVAVSIAAYSATLRYEDLPARVVDTLKRLILDCMATTLAANTLGEGCHELLAVVRQAGGRPESTILGFGDRVPAITATLVNGGMAHALNYDDTTARGGGHLGPTTLPAALAAAEMSGGASGADFLAALAAGCELMSRLGIAIAEAATGYTEAKPQPTQMPGYFAAAVTAGRVLGLTPVQMQSALGMAYMQASGGRQPVLEGRPAKAIYAAFSSQGGMLSALLAREGLEADCAVFEGEAGFFKTYYHGRFVREVLVDGLGSEFHLLNVGFKPWPTTGVAHPFIDAAITLRERHRFAAADIAAIHLRGGEHLRTFCEPAEVRRRPQSAVQAEDSVPFATSIALAHGRLGLADIQAPALTAPDVLELVDRTSYTIDSSLGSAGVLVVTITNGLTFEQRVDRPLGHPARPLPRELALEKLTDCARYAGTPLSTSALREGVALIDCLEEVDDVSRLAAIFSGRA